MVLCCRREIVLVRFVVVGLSWCCCMCLRLILFLMMRRVGLLGMLYLFVRRRDILIG